MNPIPLNNFPTYDTPFIGRDDETTTIVKLLSDPTIRWLSLIGASGTGKTRLALHVAEQIAELFPDGMFFIPFAAITNDEYIVSTIAHTLGLREASGTDLMDILVNKLQHQAVLLILDNVEQIPTLAQTITPLLERTSKIKFLVTSQQLTNQAAETLYEVPALGMPASHELLSVEELLMYPAIALFVDRFQSHQPDFVLTNANAQYVVEICKRVRGLPLALELISACSISLTVSDLLFLLKNYLAIGQWATNTRDRILTPVLDWCCSRLSADCQHVLTVFGVFVGGCTLESMRKICHAKYPTINVEEALAILCDRHLLLLETKPNHQPRYITLDAIVEYSTRLLGKLKQAQPVHQPHRQFFVDLAEEAFPHYDQAEQAYWSTYISDEHNNMRAVLRRALLGLEQNPKLRGIPIQLAGALSRFWYLQGYFSEGLTWGERVLKVDTAEPQFMARLYNGLGTIWQDKGEYNQSRHYFQLALPIWEQLNDEAKIAVSYHNLGIGYLYQKTWMKRGLDLKMRLICGIKLANCRIK